MTLSVKTAIFAAALSFAILSPIAFAQGMSGGQGGGMRADTDGDGKISFAEYEASKLKQFQQIDVNGDSVVTADELVAWSNARVADMTARMGDADRATQMMQHRVDDLKKADTDADGKITLVEFKSSYTAAFKALDSNSDGFLTADELKAGMKP